MLKRYIVIIVLVILALQIQLGWLFYKTMEAPTSQPSYVLADDYRKIFDNIETYLDSISPSYIADVKELSKKYQATSWGCGPSSYALAKIINQKFFQNQLELSAAYRASSPDIIVERFSFHQDNQSHISDHAWLEIYLGKKMLFVDPTIGQFGVTNKIAYYEFEVGDPTIGQTLAKNYGIADIRMTELVKKSINRYPAASEPYPGYMLNAQDINYYLDVLDYRNQVNSGNQPSDWNNWVAYLTDKYL